MIAIASHLAGLPPTGHRLNDPILLVLSLGNLARGWLYFNWAGLLWTLGAFLVFGVLAALSWAAVTRHTSARPHRADLQTTVRAAALVGMIPVWLQEIDGFQVLLWYAIASALGVTVSQAAARALFPLLIKS